MTPVSAPLKMSAAGMRVAGYMIESNLRVAQVFGRAAIESNPFLTRPPIPAQAVSVPKPAKAAEKSAAPAKPTAKRKKPAAPAKPAAEPAKTAAGADTADTRTGKRPRKPSLPPAMPAGKTADKTEA